MRISIFLCALSFAAASLDQAHPKKHRSLRKKGNETFNPFASILNVIDDRASKFIARNTLAKKAAKAEDAHHHWSYENQVHWPNDCVKPTSKSQSPINIDTFGKLSNSDRPALDYYESVLPLGVFNASIHNGGHNFQVSGDFGTFKSLSQETHKAEGDFKAIQFHFHSPSEHTVDGKHADAEMHIVMKNEQNGKLVVFGVLFDKGEHNEFLDAIQFDSAPAFGEDPVSLGPGVGVSVFEAFEDIFQNNHYQYQGSLTTPPCSEIVHWYVFMERSVITAEQIEHFKTIFPSPANNRNTQPLNGRAVEFFGSGLVSSIGGAASSAYKRAQAWAKRFGCTHLCDA